MARHEVRFVRIVVTGGGGQLGRSLARALASHQTTLLDHRTLDVTDEGAVEAVLRSAMPDAIVHAAAWTDVDGCEDEPVRARRINAEGTRNVARAAGEAHLVVVSTDYVFDGESGRAYVEDDEPNPLQVHGATKLAGEREASAAASRVAIARTAWLYGARRADGVVARNFVGSVLALAARGPIEVVDDQVGSPTSTEDLADAVASLIERAATGTFHVVNAGAASRFELARAVLKVAGRDPALVQPVKTNHAPRKAKRPAYAPLDGKAWRAAGFDPLPAWEDALDRAIAAFLEVHPG